MKHFLKFALLTFALSASPNIAKSSNHVDWSDSPQTLIELYMCTWQMEVLYREVDQEDVLTLWNLSKVNIATASKEIKNALNKNNIPFDDNTMKNLAAEKNDILEQKNALWLDMVNCGVTFARAGF